MNKFEFGAALMLIPPSTRDSMEILKYPWCRIQAEHLTQNHRTSKNLFLYDMSEMRNGAVLKMCNI